MVIEVPGYRIVRPLGKSTVASVFLAVHESSGRQVALKLLRSRHGDGRAFSTRFFHHARAVSELRHPNIAPVYDAGVHQQRAYLAIEHVRGRDLMEARQSFAPQQTLQILREVAGALDYAARQGVFHGNLSPENVMVRAGDGRAVVLDFGLDSLIGDGAADSRSDIYSLGVLFFLLLTGQFPPTSDEEGAQDVKGGAIPRLPGHLRIFQSIVDRTLAPDPDQRLQSGAELIAAIGQITDEDMEAIELAVRHYEAARRRGLTDGPTPHERAAASLENAVEAGEGESTAQEIPAPVSEGQPRVAAAAGSGHERPRRGRSAIGVFWPWLAAAMLVLGMVALTRFAVHLPPEISQVVDRLVSRTGELRGVADPGPRETLPAKASPGSEVPAPDPTPTPVRGSSSGAEHPAEAAEAASANKALSSSEVRQLWTQLDRDLSLAPRLAEAYRRGDSADAELALSRLADRLHQHINRALEGRNVARAEQVLKIFENTFAGHPDAISEQLKERATGMKRAARLVEQGDALLAEDKLTEPRHENAYQLYGRALDLDPDNPQARAGLRRIPERYLELAQASLRSGNHQWAIELALRGLRVDGKHEGLLSIVAGEEGDGELESVRVAARRQMTAENYLTPAGSSAFDYYLRLQDLDPGSDEARLGIARIERELIRSSETFINRNQFDRAREVLIRAREAFPESRRFQSLEDALERAQLSELQAGRSEVSGPQ
ncbi:protein kinase domain-containing protein [Gilvimarinus sp. F26214L]|uniref:protein kinase domain-containing protein n=1 Tax=Gilvimarinus sp. DZF01 TaxID=3461371 RepID=UPI0040455CB8